MLTNFGRQIFLRSGTVVKSIADPLAGLMPPSIRFGGSSYDRWSRIAMMNLGHEQAAAVKRSELLMEVLESALHGSEFYKPYRHLASQITQQSTYETLKRLPIISRDELSRHPERMIATKFADVELTSTSGSSGKPVRFYLPKSRRPAEWAFMVTAWNQACGYALGDWRVLMRGLEFKDSKPWRVSNAFSELRLSPFHMTPENLLLFQRLIAARSIRYLHGYPSAIDTLARSVIAARDPHGLSALIKAVLLISQPVTQDQRQAIAEAFPSARIVVQYGLTERIAFALERMDDPGVYDVNPMYSTVEILDEDDRPVAAGQRGRIIGTSHINTAAPIIRYDSGDTATVISMDGEWPSCRYVLADIQPRREDSSVVGHDERKVHVVALNLHSTDFSKVAEYQFIQMAPGVVKLLLVPVERSAAAAMPAVAKQFAAKLGNVFELSFEVRDEVIIPKSGKRRLVIDKDELTEK
ncbi:MAG TPA: AMP-binding protein [Trebonia sp.]